MNSNTLQYLHRVSSSEMKWADLLELHTTLRWCGCSYHSFLWPAGRSIDLDGLDLDLAPAVRSLVRASVRLFSRLIERSVLCTAQSFGRSFRSLARSFVQSVGQSCGNVCQRPTVCALCPAARWFGGSVRCGVCRIISSDPRDTEPDTEPEIEPETGVVYIGAVRCCDHRL